MVGDGDVQAEAADQLQRPQAGHVLVVSQPPLQKLLVGQQEDGPVPARDVGSHPEHLDLWLRTGGEVRGGDRVRKGHFNEPWRICQVKLSKFTLCVASVGVLLKVWHQSIVIEWLLLW